MEQPKKLGDIIRQRAEREKVMEHNNDIVWLSRLCHNDYCKTQEEKNKFFDAVYSALMWARKV